MISPEYCWMMAAYNQWRNLSLIDAADTLDDAARRAERGAFFGSIVATFNHLYWADALQMARLGWRPPEDEPLGHSLENPSEWTDYKARRAARDAAITEWARALTSADLSGEATWERPGGEGQLSAPRALLIVQLFNHQTHHRGQIHAMLTAAGAPVGPTDLGAPAFLALWAKERQSI